MEVKTIDGKTIEIKAYNVNRILSKHMLEEKSLEKIIKKYKNMVNWTVICTKQKLSENLIKKYSGYVIWEYIWQYQQLSEKFIEEYALQTVHDDADTWLTIGIYQELSEEFIEEHIEKMEKYVISKYQKLSEEFIETYLTCLDWGYILQYQQLSEKFILKYLSRLKDTDIIHLTKNEYLYKNLSSTTVLMLINKFPKYKNELLKLMKKEVK